MSRRKENGMWAVYLPHQCTCGHYHDRYHSAAAFMISTIMLHRFGLNLFRWCNKMLCAASILLRSYFGVTPHQLQKRRSGNHCHYPSRMSSQKTFTVAQCPLLTPKRWSSTTRRPVPMPPIILPQWSRLPIVCPDGIKVPQISVVERRNIARNCWGKPVSLVSSPS